LARPCNRHAGRCAGFIDEDQTGRIEQRLFRLPGGARRGDVRPLLFGGVHDFFEADALSREEPPDRPVADVNAATGKLGPDFFERQVGNRCDPLQ
jgi:hypothetical protein